MYSNDYNALQPLILLSFLMGYYHGYQPKGGDEGVGATIDFANKL